MEFPTVPCETCQKPTTFTGTKRCNNCWEVESRIRDYVQDGGENARKLLLKYLGMPDIKKRPSRRKKKT